MKNTLQYFYSISVLAGVLVTAYLMMNRQQAQVAPYREVQAPTYRTDAAVVDSAVNQLFEIESALSTLRSNPVPPVLPEQVRIPSQLRPKAK